MMDIGTVVSLFEIALGAGVLLFLVLIFSSMYRTLGDFLRALTCPEYYALNSIFLRGKRLRYVTDFPNDLRRACLVKDIQSCFTMLSVKFRQIFQFYCWKSPVCVTPEAQVPLTLESKFRMTPIKS